MNSETAQKILSPVPYNKGFHFFMPDGNYTGQTSMSLCSFLKDIGHIDLESIRFHFDRGDFQKWISNTLSDNELARSIDEMPKTSDEQLKRLLAEIVQKRISQLQLVNT